MEKIEKADKELGTKPKVAKPKAAKPRVNLGSKAFGRDKR
jgi:hypothetical protein